MTTKEQVQNLRDQMVNEDSRDRRQEIAAEIEEIMSRNSQAMQFKIIRTAEGRPDDEPRRVRVTNWRPGRPKRADETDEEYWLRCPNVTEHFDDLYKFCLTTLVQLNQIADHIGTVGVTTLPSYGEESGTYNNVVGYLEGYEEPVTVRLSRTSNEAQGNSMLGELKDVVTKIHELIKDEDSCVSWPVMDEFGVNIGPAQKGYAPAKDAPPF